MLFTGTGNSPVIGNSPPAAEDDLSWLHPNWPVWTEALLSAPIGFELSRYRRVCEQRDCSAAFAESTASPGGRVCQRIAEIHAHQIKRSQLY